MRTNNNNFSQSSNIKQQCQQRGDNNFKQLWQKVRELSEVQDESRNQQMPNFMDDNSVMSKHQQKQQQMHQSFVITHIVGQNVLLDEKGNYCDGNMFIKNKAQGVNNNKRMFNQQKDNYQQQQIKYDNILTQLDRQSVQEKPQIISNCQYADMKGSNNKSYDNKQVRNSSMTFTFNPVSSHKFPNLNLNVNKNQKRQSSQQAIKINKIEQKVIVDPYLWGETKRVQEMKQLQELNNKLMTDNRKLFQQCIKLRMKVIKLQNDNLISRQQKQKLSKQKQIQIRRQIQYNLKQTIRRQLQCNYNEKILQLQQIIVRLKQQQTHYMYQKHQQQQQFDRVNIYKQQYNQQNTVLLRQIDHLNLEINQLKSRLQLKQKQLLIKQHQIQEYQKKLKVLSYQYNVAKYSISTQTIMTELQTVQLNHNNKLPQLHYINSISQKSSRTNSTKSTTLTTSNNNNNNNNTLSSSNNNNQNQPHLLQSQLKDKQRQITNIKIVHQAQLKQYKQTIKSLQTQLQINNNKNNNINNK